MSNFQGAEILHLDNFQTIIDFFLKKKAVFECCYRFEIDTFIVSIHIFIYSNSIYNKIISNRANYKVSFTTASNSSL